MYNVIKTIRILSIQLFQIESKAIIRKIQAPFWWRDGIDGKGYFRSLAIFNCITGDFLYYSE